VSRFPNGSFYLPPDFTIIFLELIIVFCKNVQKQRLKLQKISQIHTLIAIILLYKIAKGKSIIVKK